MAVRAKREYLTSFRRSIEQRIVQPEQVRLDAADLSTIETLVQELAQPDARSRVVYAIDVLESLDKRNLITPLLLYHESPKVRARALRALAESRSETTRALGAEHPAAARRSRRRRPRRGDRRARRDQQRGCRHRSRGRCSPTTTRGSAPRRPRRCRPARGEEDLDLAEAALAGLIADTSDGARQARRDVAVAIRQTSHPRFRRLLIPLLYDPAPDVADEAMASVRAAGIGRLRLRADADRAAAPSPAEGQRADGARRLRRAGRRRARALPARSRRRRLGAAPHPRDAGADSRAEDGRRADGGARGSRRVPALQGRLGARNGCGGATPR